MTEEGFAAKLAAVSENAAGRGATQQTSVERGQWWVAPADGTGEPPPDATLSYENRPSKAH